MSGIRTFGCNYSGWLRALSALVIVLLLMSSDGSSASAAETTTEISGSVYEFDGDSHYEFSSEESVAVNTSTDNTIGLFSVSGNFSDAGGIDGIPVFTVNTGNLTLSYTFDRASFNTDEEQWCLKEDKSKNVDGIKLEKSICSAR